MSSLVEFAQAELEKPVTWAKKDNVPADEARVAKFVDDLLNGLMLAMDGASILIRERNAFERGEIDKAMADKSDAYRLREGELPNLANKVSVVAMVGIDVGKLQRMLDEFNEGESTNVYVLSMQGGGYALAFEQFGQVGIVAGKASSHRFESRMMQMMRVWEKKT